MAAPAAPLVAPEIGLTGALIILCIAWIALWGVKYGYDYTLGALLRGLANVLRFDVWKFTVDLGEGINRLNHTIEDAIAAGIQGVEYGMSKTFLGLEIAVRETLDALAWFAHDTHTTIESLVTVTIPTIAGGVARPIGQQLGEFRNALRHRVDQELQRFARGIDRLTRDLHAETLARLRGIDAIEGTIAARLAGATHVLEGELRDVIGYTRRTLARRLSRLEKALAAGVIGAVAVAALTRVFPYWQCTNVRGFNRALCRAPVGGLDDFLAFALAAEIIVALPEMVRLMQTVAEETAAGLHELASV